MFTQIRRNALEENILPYPAVRWGMVNGGVEMMGYNGFFIVQRSPFPKVYKAGDRLFSF
jgi:hypothetical protein